MYKIDQDKKLYLTIFITLVLPIFIGMWLQNYNSFRFISIPFHSFLEATGALAALTMALIIFIMYSHLLVINSYHRASLALITMGVFDAFHAMVYPGELFVWLHSLAVFAGGLIFAIVWLPDMKVSQKSYKIIPLIFFSSAIFISILSIAYPSLVPQMLTKENEFTYFANFLNLIGGILFIVASFYYIKKYLTYYDDDDLLFAGHTLLFGTAGVLFFFSNIWDAQWWLWHFLRFVAYMIALYYLIKLFNNSLVENYENHEAAKVINQKLLDAMHSLQEHRRAYDESSFITVSDLKGNIVYINDAMLQKTNYTKKELIGQPHSILRDKNTPKQLFAEMWKTIQDKQTWRGMIKNRKKDGSSFYVNLTVVPLLNAEGEIVEYIGIRDDVTELVQSKRELKKQFYTDKLTTLYNRSKLISDLEYVERPMLVSFNIKGFKNYNDFFGSDFGDKLLIEVSNLILNNFISKEYTIYRNHADEFIILKSYNPIIKNLCITEIVDFLNLINSKKFNINFHEIALSLSCGISFDYADILHVDMALKESKKTKKEYVIYSDSLTVYDEYKKNIYYSKILRDAITNERVFAEFQPIYNLQTKSIEKYETLIRIKDENNLTIYPNNFLEISKQTRLYHELTRRVIKEGIAFALQSGCEVSINITADDILDVDTSDFILNNLKSINYANKIVFELVESEGIESFESVMAFFTKLKQLGSKIAIDDFGTGYSNFDYLIRLKADFIKIDGSLIKNLDTDKNHYAVVETIVVFAKKNGLKIIAEFVHSEEILGKVYELGIEYAQGFYIGKPSREVQ